MALVQGSYLSSLLSLGGSNRHRIVIDEDRKI